MKKIFFWLVVIPPIMAIFFVTIHILYLLNWSYDGPELHFQIRQGEGFSSINQRLWEQGIISNPRIFHHYTRFTNSLQSLKTGTYLITPGSNMKELLKSFVSGKSLLEVVTITEGKNMYQIAEQLAAKNVITSSDKFLELCQNPELLSELGIKGETIEGYLFPETYYFSPGTPSKHIIKIMVSQFQKATKDLNFQHPNLSKEQIITLASIVEKETGAEFERRTIAGVFHNRLKKKMRLQSDPTTIYGMWERFDGNIRKSDLFEKTKYNTYQIPSLPPGPIANPSLSAIKAVIDPEEHNYLYFVSKNDGTHIFSTNYKDHDKAVTKYQRMKKYREGRSWRQLKQ